MIQVPQLCRRWESVMLARQVLITKCKLLFGVKVPGEDKWKQGKYSVAAEKDLQCPDTRRYVINYLL